MSSRTGTPEDDLRKDDTRALPHSGPRTITEGFELLIMNVQCHLTLLLRQPAVPASRTALQQQGHTAPGVPGKGQIREAETRGPLSHSIESQGWDSVLQAAPDFFQSMGLYTRQQGSLASCSAPPNTDTPVQRAGRLPGLSSLMNSSLLHKSHPERL